MMNGKQRRALVMYSGMAKGISQAKRHQAAKNQARSLSHCRVMLV